METVFCCYKRCCACLVRTSSFVFSDARASRGAHVAYVCVVDLCLRKHVFVVVVVVVIVLPACDLRLWKTLFY